MAWKKNRRPWLAFLRQEDMPLHEHQNRLYYRGWVAVPLEVILKQEDAFFFAK